MNYLIIGDDGYIKERETERLKKEFLSLDEIILNYSVFSHDDMENAMSSLVTLPFLSKKRVVVLNGIDNLMPERMEGVLFYLEHPLETSVLIMWGGSSFRTSKHYGKLSKLTNVISVNNPDTATIKNWIRNFFKKEKIEISANAVDLVVELKGTNTIDVKAELDKLVCFSGGKKIDVEHVEQIVGRSIAETVFKLVDALEARNAKWVFRILNDLYGQKKQPHEIIGYLSWHTRIMQKIILLSGRGLGIELLASELSYSPGYVRRLLEQSKRYTAEKLNKWGRLLFETDKDIKQGIRQPVLALDMLLSAFLQ